MEKHIYNDQSGISYTLHGDYYLPDLTTIPEEENVTEIGLWGQRHLRYIKQHRKVLYFNLLTTGKLNGYLADINKQAEEMQSLLVKQMAVREGVTEQLKADNYMEWIFRMNSIRSRVIEIINSNIVFP